MRKEQIDELPYERFLEYGPESLTESELLAIIIRTGTKDRTATDIARDILQSGTGKKRGLLGLHEISIEELMQIKGIGKVKAVKIKCIIELSLRLSRARALENPEFHTACKVAEYFMESMRHRNTECVMLLCMDSKGQVLSEKKISEGSVRMSLISPREIFLEALQSKAVNIILVHNHPSGNPTPSKSDIALTENVRRTGEMLDIPLLDHIIIGDNCYMSFKEANWFI